MRRYDIHGLIDVVIASNVAPEVVNEIDFQIGAFLVEKGNSGDGVPTIRIQPFADASTYDPEDGLGDAVFYQSRGSVGCFVRDGAEKIFVARTSSGFVICADYSNFLINLYIQLLLSEMGMTMMHAAAFEAKDGRVTILAGAGGIGKTAVLGYVVGEQGLKHLGDDIIIVDGAGVCHAFPRQFVLKSYHKEIYSDIFEAKRLPKWNAYGLKRFIIENAPFVGFFKRFLKQNGLYYRVANLLRPQPFLASVSPDEVFGAGTMARNGKIGHIVYLDRSFQNEFSSSSIQPDVLVNRLFSVIHYEWKDFMTHLLTLGSLDVIDLPKYFERSHTTFTSIVADAETTQINIPEDAPPQRLIQYLEDQGVL
ncbi:MAG: hypothetical protein P1U89_26205 [Verrucomicrobiales bacterium]|nr:hypothetical protein [Verrucomicrobiales bacterium]